MSRSACSAEHAPPPAGAARRRLGRRRGDRRGERPRRAGRWRSARCSARSSSSATTAASARCSSAALLAAGPLASRRGEQRVRRAHALAVEPDEAAVDRILERLAVPDRDQLVDRQLAAERDREQHPAGSPGAAGRRACSAGLRPRPARGDRPRPKPAGPARPACARPRARTAGCPASTSTIWRSSGRGRLRPSRSDSSRRVAPRLSGPISRRSHARLERALEHRAAAGAAREQERDRLAGEPAGGERERLGRRRVEPLDVVDRDDDRAVGGDRAQQVQEPERDRARRPAARARARRAAARSPAPSVAGPAALPARARRRRRKVDSARRTSAAPRRRSAAPSVRASRAPARASTPASQSVVLPIPGPPASTSARGATSDSTKPRTASSSVSRPTIWDCASGT